jgi:dolichyl-phosphate-mannose--protein O-mannosyl transferase
VIRPVWFYQAPGIEEGDLREIFAFPNPLVWFPMFVAIGVLAYRSVERRNLGEFLLLAFFGAVWLPWAVIGRVTFIQYILPAMPFGAAALGGGVLRLAAAGHPMGLRLFGPMFSGLREPLPDPHREEHPPR